MSRVALTLRITTELRDDLSELAEKEGVTKNALICRILDAYVSDDRSLSQSEVNRVAKAASDAVKEALTGE